MKIWAVGDIHGCLNELKQLHEIVLPTIDDEDCIIYLGDYIDRGPDSKGVVEELLAVEESHDSIFLRGNHEDMMLAYLGYTGMYGSSWYNNGAESTFDSYEIMVGTPCECKDKIGKEHLRFLITLRYSYTIGNHFFVHAGINPNNTLEEQTHEDLVWIREPFLQKPHDLGVTVVHGHTPKKTAYYNLPYEINLDSGCVFGHKLTALKIDLEKQGDDRYSLLEISAAKRYY